MPAPATLLLLAAILPLVAFGLLLALGRRMGSPLAGWVSTFFAALSFGASLWAMVVWCSPGGRHYHGVEWGLNNRPISLASPVSKPGVREHRTFFDPGIYVDSLTIAMFLMVTLVAAVVGVFAIGYMREDPDYPLFFVHLSWLCFTIFGLLLCGSLTGILLFWLLGTVAAIQMIRFWRSAQAVEASDRAVPLLCLGDLLLLIGLILLGRQVGNATFPGVWTALSVTHQASAISSSAGTTISILLILGVSARAAIFPLHAWWGAAAEAPAPAGPLIHIAGFSITGIYLLARFFPILPADSRLLLAILGVATALSAALIAIAQDDIKRAVSYCLLSQIGLMACGLGIGSWGGALFHLVTCGFMGTLLLLACGSVIRISGGERCLSRMGGLFGRAPVTAVTFAVGALALAGMGGFAGEYSRSAILADAGALATLAAPFAGRSGMYRAFFALPTASAYLVAFALARCWLLAFTGRGRGEKTNMHSSDSPILWTPLLALAVLSIFAGSVLGVPQLLQAAVKESQNEVRPASLGLQVKSVPGIFEEAWPIRTVEPSRHPETVEGLADLPPDEFTPAAYARAYGEQLERRWARWAWLVGLLAAGIVYSRGLAIPAAALRSTPLQWVHRWLLNEMYFPEMYEWVFGRPAAALVRFVAKPTGAIIRASTRPR